MKLAEEPGEAGDFANAAVATGNGGPNIDGDELVASGNSGASFDEEQHEEGELANAAVTNGNGGEGIDKEPREENEALGEDAFAESGRVEVDGNDAANAAIVDAESAREE